MTKERIVIIGGVAGGATCAARARRLSEEAEIIVLERGPFVSFANCGLPYHIGGEIADRSKLVLQTPEGLKKRFNLDVRTHTEATGIDRAGQTVETRDTRTGATATIAYDHLVLAMGAAPLHPPIPGIDRPGLFTLRNIPDMDAIIAWIESSGARNAVVVGGGYIGLEMAEQLHRRGLRIALAEMLPQVMAPLDPEMAAFLHAELKENGIALHLGDGVAAFDDTRDGESAASGVVVLKSGARLPADLIILGLGVRPEVHLARDAGLEIGKAGGIRVDEHHRTADPRIWAVGDAVEVINPVTGNHGIIPLAGPANRQGRMVADNILGEGPRKYAGTLGTAALRLFKLTAACTGANERALLACGREYKCVHLHPGHHVGYFPGAKPIALKILFDPGTGHLLGAQAVGEEGVDKRIDVLAVALRACMTVDDLAELELCYAPPYGAAKDPVNLAGMAAQNIRAGLVDVVHWNQMGTDALAGAFILDVRDAAETKVGMLPGAKHIPLGELRQRLEELPRDREIVVHCQSGQRSYNACRLLSQRGFSVRNLSGSWRTWSTATR